jgi:nitroreductase
MSTNNYDILKSICENRKSTRSFADKEVPKEDIQKIIDIAKTSPYASGLTNWEIEVITTPEMITKLSVCVKQKATELTSLIRDDVKEHFLTYSKSFSFFENAPVLFILTFRISPIIMGMMGNKADASLLQWERDNFTKSISCAAMLVLLAAESLGLGACYMTGPLITQNAIMKLAGSKPGREIGAIIPIGYKKN